MNNKKFFQKWTDEADFDKNQTLKSLGIISTANSSIENNLKILGINDVSAVIRSLFVGVRSIELEVYKIENDIVV
jgi:hypothetical protein